jgi:hypothetical protein
MAVYFSRIGDVKNHHGLVLSMCMKPISGYRNIECLAPTEAMVYGHKAGKGDKRFVGRYKALSDCEYTVEYRALLAERRVEVRKFIDGLELARDYTLLCYCPEGAFCHRRLLAKWFKSFRPELEVVLH